MIFGDDGVAIDWSATVSGIDLVSQKLINNMMTDLGTDEIVPSRGTRLLRTVTGGGVYDLRSAQHALNFAALASKRTVRAFEPAAAAAADKVADFSVLLDGVVEQKLVTKLVITTEDGASIGLTQPLI
jgi:hypothetical protein